MILIIFLSIAKYKQFAVQIQLNLLEFTLHFLADLTHAIQGSLT